jgi:hypothetical protein
MTVDPDVMSDVSMLTLLIQASSIVKNKNGDASQHGYVERQEQEQEQEQQEKQDFNSSEDAEFAVLNYLGDILVQDSQVLAACYDGARSITLVTSNANSESDSKLDLPPDSFDMDFPPHESVRLASTLQSIDATIVPNPDDREDAEEYGQSSGVLGKLGEIREIEVGECLWNEEEPLHNIAK